MTDSNEVDRHKAMISIACLDDGLPVPKEWFTDEDDRVTARLGTYHAIDDDEEAGFYVDDEGELTASVVGALKYGNERVCFAFCPTGHDYGSEVKDLLSLEASS